MTEVQDFAALLARETATAMLHVDGRGVIRFWNDGATALFGHAGDEAVGRSADLIIPANLRPAHGVCFAAAMKGGWKGSASWDGVEALHASGASLPVEVFLTPVANGALALFRRGAGAA